MQHTQFPCMLLAPALLCCLLPMWLHLEGTYPWMLCCSQTTLDPSHGDAAWGRGCHSFLSDFLQQLHISLPFLVTKSFLHWGDFPGVAQDIFPLEQLWYFLVLYWNQSILVGEEEDREGDCPIPPTCFQPQLQLPRNFPYFAKSSSSSKNWAFIPAWGLPSNLREAFLPPTVPRPCQWGK